MKDYVDYVVGQFIGGRIFFLGIAVCLLGCSLKLFFRQTRMRSIARVTTVVGGVLVVLSAAPFPFWVYGIFFVVLGLATFRPAKGPWQGRKGDGLLLALLAMQSILMVRMEVRHSTLPTIPFMATDSLFVVGDSVSMGADPPGKNWPELLGELANLRTRNLSFGGATVESSLFNAERIDQPDALVILEIGGNDLLGGTSIPEFRNDLERMLTLVCRPDRRVVMIELPLPPFYNRFGRVQRELARTHGVTLIPKRVLAKVISTPGATVDGLHLSNAGHVLLARGLFEMFTPTE